MSFTIQMEKPNGVNHLNSEFMSERIADPNVDGRWCKMQNNDLDEQQ